ncbi:MAG: endonuclease [Herbinix sp.]|jgi:formamidopyrimidine-DNA glycosylase|nr:endonuclease [Herbinix sp.]
MIELPESRTLAGQINEIVKGKTILNVYANKSPHKFAWFRGDPGNYHNLLNGKIIEGAKAYGGMVEIKAEEMRLIFCDGTNIRYYQAGEEVPLKHQLQIEFDDFSNIVCSVQMYGGIWALNLDQTEGYCQISEEKISVLSDDFNENYFNSLFTQMDNKLSTKAFLATKQRIPGLGNGVLQDILFNARLHPKRKMSSLSDEELEAMYKSVKNTLFEMTARGGRDTEKDLYGCSGGYKTILSKKTKGLPCPICQSEVIRESYLGGNIYFCPVCQSLEQ